MQQLANRQTNRPDQLIHDYFAQLARVREYRGPLGLLVECLGHGELTRKRRHQILGEAGLLYDLTFRKAELDLLLAFALSAMETKSFDLDHEVALRLVKEVFEVEEGEFLEHRPVELATLLGAQLDMILEDGVIDPSEDIYQVALQDAFDLGYDQYLALCRRALEHAWFRLWEALREQRDPYLAQYIRKQLDDLGPLYLLAQKQRRSLGALY
jgi:hypothetical protein